MLISKDVRAYQISCAESAENSRIEFLVQRDGIAATQVWVRRTLAIYRSAVLNRKHFAHNAEYRTTFIVSCLSFRRWLALNDVYGN
jgi:hypothetical protein